MKRSAERMLTTHAGSLPRGAKLTELLVTEEHGETVDRQELLQEMGRRVAHVVRKQIEAGIDIPNDGEQPRVGFQTYVAQRMAGFGGESHRAIPKDFTDWPEFAARRMAAASGQGAKIRNAPQAVAEVRYGDLANAVQECDLLLRNRTSGVEEYFMTSASPGIIATTMHNAYYDRYEDYVFALAREMRREYRVIVDRGLLLQIDAPDLAMERTMMFQDRPISEFLDAVRLHISALNEALEGIPADKVRLHCCWGNWEGPHVHDVALADVLPLLYEANVGALSIPFANPRHQHEYEVLRKFRLPDRLVLVPGVIDPTTNFVEHPEVVAERIERAVSVVGDKERVIAGTDCGFSTFAGYGFSPEEIVWAKLRSLADGAAIATDRLWK
jgi:5-methyltetrahydropteroyltriglutamate--homocysteine methyltransferase